MMKNIKIIAVVILVVLIGYGIWWGVNNQIKKAEEKVVEEVITLADDTTQSINDAIKNIAIETIDEGFDSLDHFIDQL